nr:FAD-dependent monooxygenase [Rhizobium sp. TCK]
MSTISTQVLIVGAGPAGLATAIGLAQKGVDLRIVDALAEAQNTSRAAVVHAATLENLEMLGVAGDLLARGIKVPNFRIRDRDDVLLHIDFTVLPGKYRHALMIPQDETEAILTNRLRVLGHEVMRPVEFRRFDRVGDGFRIALDMAGDEVSLDCRYLVGADGMRSAVRDAGEIGFPGKTYGSFMLADVRMQWPIASDEVTLFFSEAGTLVVAPMSERRYRVVAQHPDAPAEPDLADVQAILDARGPRSGARVEEVLWGSRFHVHHKLSETFHDRRLLLVGDAAHVHSPAGGQGMNLGLRDAVALAEALSVAIDTQNDEPLRHYDGSRRAAAREVLGRTDRLTQLATLKSPVLRWMRNRLIRMMGLSNAARRRFAAMLAGFS